MTNLEKLQKASLEELAEMLTNLTEYIETGGETLWTGPYDCGLPRSCARRDFIKWLKEEISDSLSVFTKVHNRRDGSTTASN